MKNVKQQMPPEMQANFEDFKRRVGSHQQQLVQVWIKNVNGGIEPIMSANERKIFGFLVNQIAGIDVALGDDALERRPQDRVVLENFE